MPDQLLQFERPEALAAFNAKWKAWDDTNRKTAQIWSWSGDPMKPTVTASSQKKKKDLHKAADLLINLYK